MPRPSQTISKRASKQDTLENHEDTRVPLISKGRPQSEFRLYLQRALPKAGLVNGPHTPHEIGKKSWGKKPMPGVCSWGMPLE